MKRFLVAVAVGVAALAMASPASATRVQITVTCTEATFNYTAFPTNIQSSAVQTVVVDGAPPITSTVQFQSETFVSTIPLSITGTASVTATSNWTAHRTGTETTTTTVECGGGTDTGGTDTGGDTGTTDTGGDTGTDTGGDTGTTDTGGTTATGGVIGGTTGGSGEASGELPFTGLPIWVPILLAAALLASGVFLLRRKRDDVS